MSKLSQSPFNRWVLNSNTIPLTTTTISSESLHFPSTHISARTVIVTSLDLAQGSVGEVELLCFVVDSQSIGGQDVRADDDPHVLAC